jgi:hypothetical protein
MSYTLKEMFLSLGYGVLIGTVVGATSLSMIMPNLYQTGEKKGIEKGRTEATSNLVSAVNTLAEKSRNNLFLRVNGVVDNETLTLKEKEAYLNSAHDIVYQIESIRGDLSKNAERYAAGEKPSTNQTLKIQALNIKIGDFY